MKSDILSLQAAQGEPLEFTSVPGTLFGIDVSHFQGKIDWASVKAQYNGASADRPELTFVYLKASEGATNKDSTFAANRKALGAAGLPCGAYHFFHPKVDVATQVDNFCTAVGRLKAGDLPPVLDVEAPPQWAGIAVAERVRLILTWLTAVEKRLGVRPVIYTGNDMAPELAHDARLAGYKLWLAYYTTSQTAKVPAPWKIWTFWQYSETGTIKGVGAKCDLDRFHGSKDDLKKLLVQSSQLPVTHRIANWWTGLFS